MLEYKMINEKFFLSLPDDPEEAFPIFERHVREIVFKDDWEQRNNDDCERDYISYILAFVSYYKIDIGISDEIPNPGSDFWVYYNELRRRVNFCSAQFSLRRLARSKAGFSAIYILPPALKTEVHHYLGLIRQLIAEADLSEQKREVLARKLNAFAEEVDRDRTRFEALAAAMIWTKREIKDGADILNPVLEKLEKVMDKFTKAKELPDALPSPSRAGEIEASPKRIEWSTQQRQFGDDIDDEIPF